MLLLLRMPTRLQLVLLVVLVGVWGCYEPHNEACHGETA